MLLPRYVARLGLGAACLVLISCLAVLHSKAAEAGRALRAQPLRTAPFGCNLPKPVRPSAAH